MIQDKNQSVNTVSTLIEQGKQDSINNIKPTMNKKSYLLGYKIGIKIKKTSIEK